MLKTLQVIFQSCKFHAILYLKMADEDNKTEINPNNLWINDNVY